MRHRDATLTGRAHAIRLEPTEPEKRLWRHLSNSQLDGFKFRRQAVIGSSIADFLCPAKALILEVDGDTHDPERDTRRDRTLGAQGYTTLRFTNADVMQNVEGVLAVISRTLNAAPDRWAQPHPNPSPEGEGLTAGPESSPSPSEEGLGVGRFVPADPDTQ